MGPHPHNESIIVSQALLAQQGKPAYKKPVQDISQKDALHRLFSYKIQFYYEPLRLSVSMVQTPFS